MSKSVANADFNPFPETPSTQVVVDFFSAVEAGDAEATRDMLELFPVLVEWKDNDARATALIVAAKQGHVDVVAVLDAVGADIEATDAGAMDAISYAACNGHQDVADYLIDHGADAAKKGRHGISAIDCARAADFYSFADHLQRRMQGKAQDMRAEWDNQAEACASGLTRPLKPMPLLTFKQK